MSSCNDQSDVKTNFTAAIILRITMLADKEPPEIVEILDDEDADEMVHEPPANKPKSSPSATFAPIFAQAKASSSSANSRQLKRRESGQRVEKHEPDEPDTTWSLQLKEDIGEDAFAEPASKKRKTDAVKEAQP